MKLEMFEQLPADEGDVTMQFAGQSLQRAFVTLLEKIAKVVSEKAHSPNEIYEFLIYKQVLRPGYYREFRRLLRFGVREGIINEKNLVSWRRPFKKLPNVFTKEQLIQYFHHCSDVRVAMASFLAFWCGFRTGEIVRLKVADFDFENCLIKVIDSKKNKDRYVPFIPKIHDVVKKWIKYIGKYEYLFPSYESRSFASLNENYIDVHTLSAGFNKALSAAGLDHCEDRYRDGRRKGKFSFYAFRHSFATHNIERRVPIELVQKAMGHERIDTTIRSYTHIRDPVMVEAITKAFEPKTELPKIQASSPVGMLAQKFASGELSEEEFTRRKRILSEAGF